VIYAMRTAAVRVVRTGARAAASDEKRH